ncbi:hypothetical protein B0O80DRAFT_498855 [Mortierella sp. GBAus27b]|nr:hypothetical protein B0O80DRAFT_498855 [Mortierella sp. GBAus27b]
MSMLTIPDEILIHLLTFVEDIDLQMLALTCKRLRSFTIDGALRRFILLKRTPARIQSSLSYRSSRDALAKRNILRGIHIRQQIQDGEYISGPIAVQSYHISRRLERQIVSMKLNKKLGVRPDWTELVERGLIPEEMFVNQDECETRHKWRLYRKQQKAMDHQDNQHSGTTHLSRHQGVPQKGPQGDSPRHTFTPSRLYSSSSEPLSCPTRPRRQRKSISMALVPTMTLLRKAMDRDRLSRLFQNRPSYTELNQTPRTAAAGSSANGSAGGPVAHQLRVINTP